MALLRICCGIYLCVLFSQPSAWSQESRVPLYILGLYPMSGDWPGGQGQLPATRLGLEHVNANANILPGFELKLISKDTKCDGGRGVHEMYKELYNQSLTYIMVLGDGCSKVTEPTAMTSHFWNLIQVSYSSASPRLSDRKLFPMFFRLFPPETNFNVVKFAILHYFGWKKVGTLHQTLDLFSLPTAAFLQEAGANGIDVIAVESFSKNPALHVGNLKRKGVRIIIGNFYEPMAREVLCEAFKQGMYGENYVWIITGWYSNFWWKDTSEINCTVEQMTQAVKGYFTVDALPLNPNPTPGIANISTDEFWSRYREYVEGDIEELTGYQEAPYGFDSIWAMALALQEAETILSNQDIPKSIADFSYDDDSFADLMLDIMNRTNFVGVSGPVQFTAMGDRRGLMQVEQNQDEEERKVGIYDSSVPANQSLSWTADIVWQGDGPPADSVVREEVLMNLSGYLFGVMTSCAVFGIFLAIFFLVFNIRHRHKRYIKMSSPNLNNLILLGGILAYLSMIFYGIDRALVSENVLVWMCKFHLWTLSASFSMAFGAMFTKTWRVHRIFTSKNIIRTQMIKDHRLYIMIGFLILFDFILFLVWELTSPFHIVRYERILEGFEDDDRILVSVSTLCSSELQVYFYGVLLAFDGLLLLFGAFLAWETRQVTVPALNDSKYIGMSVYTVVVLCFIGVPVALVLDDVDARYTLLSMFIFFATTLTLCMVFIPKLRTRNLVQPKGSLMSTISEARRETDSERRIRQLSDRLQHLQGRLEQRENRIKELESTAGSGGLRPPTPSATFYRTQTSAPFAEASEHCNKNSTI